MKLNLPKTVPYLPGHVFSDPYKENHHKTQQFSVINGINCENLDPDLLDNLRLKTPLNMTYGSRNKPENDYIPRIQPPWLKYNRKVLRFAGYFQESVSELPTENYRLRKCLIYFYLEDGTIHVTEPKIENSGIPQGIFIKRQKIPKVLNSTDEYITWEDLNLSENINFFQRTFRIVDCDDFTRKFFEEMGRVLNYPEPMPVDNFEIQKALKDAKINPPDTKEYKEYFEVKLGGGHPNNGLKQYLENDRRVLSFDVLWDDQTLEGQVNLFKLNFFLADNTVEVKEFRQNNSGKDPFPLLLTRKKLPKRPILTHYPGMTLQKEEYYSPEDLICGKKIVVYERECIIYNCDIFTKKWYLDNYGVVQEPLPLKQDKQKKFKQPVPPYNGYGTAEDSLGSVYNLQPKPPKKDFHKMFTSDQYILRFESRMISKNKEENSRRYIISFFCGDDTIMVYLVSPRNSGVVGGKFLESEKSYIEKDFQLGEIIDLAGYKFQLMKADEFTHKYMTERPEVFPERNIKYVIDRIKSFSSKFKSFDEFLIQLMKTIDKNNNGFIEFEELSQGLTDLGITISLQEQYTVMRYFDTNGDWKLSMKELYEGLSK